MTCITIQINTTVATTVMDTQTLRFRLQTLKRCWSESEGWNRDQATRGQMSRLQKNTAEAVAAWCHVSAFFHDATWYCINFSAELTWICMNLLESHTSNRIYYLVLASIATLPSYVSICFLGLLLWQTNVLASLTISYNNAKHFGTLTYLHIHFHTSAYLNISQHILTVISYPNYSERNFK